MSALGATVALGPTWVDPGLVSVMRLGTRPVNRDPPAVEFESVNQPPTSTTTSTVPAPPWWIITWPLVPTLAITRLGTVWPGRS